MKAKPRKETSENIPASKRRISCNLPETTITKLDKMSKEITFTDRGKSRIIEGAIEFAYDNPEVFKNSLRKKELENDGKRK